MNFVIIQLSDIHFQSQRKFVANRTGEIARAVLARYPDCTSLLLILSGDIAFSGQKTEYAIATGFVQGLTKSLKELKSGLAVRVLGVPGNHDCDYNVPGGDMRSLVLSIFCSDTKKLEPGSQPLSSVLSVQSECFEFLNRVSETAEASANEQVFRSVDIQIGKSHLRVNLINTALGCQRHKDRRETDQGKLFVPISFLGASQFSSVDTYAVTVLHHPLNWLESNNSVEMRHWIASSSDLVLTGHQHEHDAESKDWISKERNLWVRAAALQEEAGGSSGFNTVAVDLDHLSEEVTQFTWQGSAYLPGETRAYSKTEEQRSGRRSIPLLDEMRDRLDDPGTGFTHPSKKKLKLSDIFVEPKLSRLLGVGKSSDGHPSGNEDVRALALPDAELTILLGETRAGKTTLAKRIFESLYNGPTAISPLFIDASEIDSSHIVAGKLSRLVEKSFNAQYSPKSWEQFNQLGRARRVLFVDNWQASRVNDAGRRELLRLLSLQYGRILLLADDTVKIEETAPYTDSFAENGQFTAYKIAPFGHLLRAKLIQKWLAFGEKYSTGHKELHVQVTTAERTLGTVLDRSLFPAYPVFILALLQTYQDIKITNHANGSYGYLYESLITSALTEVSSPVAQVDLYYTVLGRIAWELFISQRDSVTGYQLNKLIADYGIEYKTVVDPSSLVNQLLLANILASSDGYYWFKYKYIYYFFTARFLADRLKTPSLMEETKRTMLSLVASLTEEENANIIIFLIYLTRDADLLGRLIEKARSLFVDASLFDAEKEVEFLAPKVERLLNGRTVDVAGSPEVNKDSERNSRDSYEASYSRRAPDEQADRANNEYAQAVKLMDIMGQAVRNFPGSMPGDAKVALASEVYKLGLRAMSATVKLMEQGMPEVRDFLGKAIRGNRSADQRELADDDLERRVDRLVVVFAGIVCLGITRTISSAVGLAQLKPIYIDIKADLGPTAAVELIDVSIALDHGPEFPKSQLLRLCDNFSKKWFARMILQQLVAYHFSMFHVDPAVAKSIGQKVGVNMTNPKVVAQLASKR